MNEEKWKQVFNLVLIKEIIQKTKDYTDNQSPEHTLIGMEGDTDNG